MVVAASLYFGLTLNNEGLTNIGYFTGWLFAVMGILLIFVDKDKFAKTYKHQSIAWRTYDVLTDVAYVTFAAYSGWFVLATFFAIASIIKAAIKSDAEKILTKSLTRKQYGKLNNNEDNILKLIFIKNGRATPSI